jgi:hypothetical protein
MIIRVFPFSSFLLFFWTIDIYKLDMIASFNAADDDGDYVIFSIEFF